MNATTIEVCIYILSILTYTLRLSSAKLFCFCNFAPPWIFLPLYIRLEYRIQHVSFGLLYVMFMCPTYSTAETQDLQLIALVVFDAVE